MHALLQRFATLSYSLKGRSTASSADPDNLDLVWQTLQPTHVPPLDDSRQFTLQAKETLRSFMDGSTARSAQELAAGQSSHEKVDTVLQPFLQMGPFDIRQETEVVVPAILQEAASDPGMKIDWTSGYFSLRRPYKDGLLAAKGPVRIVCAAPEVRPSILRHGNYAHFDFHARQTDFISLLASRNIFLRHIHFSSGGSTMRCKRRRKRRPLTYTSGRDKAGRITQKVRQPARTCYFSHSPT